MTLPPCRTLQNVIQTQKCVPCRGYASLNKCVFKCFAKVSEQEEEDLKSAGRTFQLLGPATAKDLNPQSVRWLGTTMSQWAADLKADRPGTNKVLKQQSARYAGTKSCRHLNIIIHSLHVMRWGYGSQCKSTRAGVMWSNRFKPKIKRAAEFNTDWSCAAWETKASMQEHYYKNPTDYELTHAPTEVWTQQSFPQTTNLTKLEITVLTDTRNMLRHCHIIVKYYAQIANRVDWSNMIAKEHSVIPNKAKVLATTVKPNQFRLRRIKFESIGRHPLTDRIRTITETLQHDPFRTNIHVTVHLMIISIGMSQHIKTMNQLHKIRGIQQKQYWAQHWTLRNTIF